MRVIRGGAASLVICLLTSTASAQGIVQRSFSSQLFEPAMGTDSLMTIELGPVAKHLAFGVGLTLNYQYKPVVFTTQLLRDAGGTPVSGTRQDIVVVENQITTDITGVFGFHHRWLRAQVGLSLPINLYVGGNNISDVGLKSGSLSGTVLGDIKLQLKVNLLDRWRGLALSFSPIISFPTGCAAADTCGEDGKFGGSNNLTFRPRVVADYQLGPVLLAANIGWLFREDTQVYSTLIGDQLLYGVGAAYDVHRRVRVMAELFGRAGFSSAQTCTTFQQTVVCEGDSGFDPDRFPMELALGGQLATGYALQVTAGAGFGVIRGVGAPQVRFLAGLRWVPDFADTDRDGITDGNDRCPTQAEDRDGFEDTDGCPDLDNDGDLVPDAQDKCPNEKEDADSFQDSDGCPDPDNDKDGIEDRLDHCPFKAETINNYKDEDGCPDLPDKDNDGIEDSRDGCPDKPETINGLNDADGCPDEGDVKIEPARIVLATKIAFTRQTQIATRSHTMLAHLAAALQASPEIRELKIVARPPSAAKKQALLWESRAQAVREFLVKQGVGAARLVVGVGGPERQAGIEIVITRRK